MMIYLGRKCLWHSLYNSVRLLISVDLILRATCTYLAIYSLVLVKPKLWIPCKILVHGDEACKTNYFFLPIIGSVYSILIIFIYNSIVTVSLYFL